MHDEERGSSSALEFGRIVLPHLDAAYNLARWLVRNPHDAEDVVQDACMRAFKFFGGYQGGNARGWLLRIVRNAAYTFIEKRRPADLAEEFDETLHTGENGQSDVEDALLKSANAKILQEALEDLPVRYREVLILREIEGLSYKEIAEVVEIPIGTVMSSLARSRAQLRERLVGIRRKEVPRGMSG
ncbi:MAG TPA: sigma-70 family RNA polymerase sigma factor [Candidatus Acidoferrales bacterium]|jgi:RNA polymerase sigma-70 factor (ECF subfamily)|nr:sigma-70 family RNA polymerase sigma factor [Candidatus Acidoferrales bacterium]